jgi:glucose-6-phosphate isomerase
MRWMSILKLLILKTICQYCSFTECLVNNFLEPSEALIPYTQYLQNYAYLQQGTMETMVKV